MYYPVPHVLLLADPNRRNREGAPDTRERQGAIFSLAARDLRKSGTPAHEDLSSILRLNKPSQYKLKLACHANGSVDPVIDYMMSSKIFRAAIWIFLSAMMALELTSVTLSFMDQGRMLGLVGVGPVCFLTLPVWLLCAMPCSRRLK